MVEVLGRYSKLSDQGQRLDSILKLYDEPTQAPRSRTPRRVCRRLNKDEIADLVKAYAEGELLDQLVARFRVDPTTIETHVRAAGIPKRRHWVGPRQLEQAVKLYEGGRSVKFIADQLGVGATTVKRALSKAGVQLRRRRRPTVSAHGTDPCTRFPI
jgi:phage-related baseplate assembly protein